MSHDLGPLIGRCKVKRLYKLREGVKPSVVLVLDASVAEDGEDSADFCNLYENGAEVDNQVLDRLLATAEVLELQGQSIVDVDLRE